MADIDPNLSGGNGNGAQDGGNANHGGGNSQGQGGSGNGVGGQDPNHGGGSGNQAGGDVDYRAKFGESTKEANRLLDVLKANGIDPKTGKKADEGGNGGDGGAGDQPIFTDDDLQAAFPSFATMSEQEKTLLKQVGSFPKMMRMVAEMYDKNTFAEQLDTIKADPANKIIADNEREFREYAYKDGNLKLPMDVLVNAFIGMKLRSQGTQDNGGNGTGNGNGTRRTAKRDGMETGTNGQGGGNDTANEMTAEQASDLRKKDPRKYAALARTGKLRIVSE